MRGWRTRLVLAGVATLICLTAAAARADTVGILEVASTGVPRAAVENFESALVDGLELASFEVRPRAAFVAALKRSNWVEGCNFGPCVRQVFKATGVPLALTLRVQGVGSSYMFVASLIDTREGTLVAQAKRDCAACSVNDAEAAASMLGSDLLLARSQDDGAKPVQTSTSSAQVSSGPGLGRDAESRRASLRVTAYVFLAAAIVGGATGGYFMADDDMDLGTPLVAGAGATLLGSITMFAFSRHF